VVEAFQIEPGAYLFGKIRRRAIPHDVALAIARLADEHGWEHLTSTVPGQAALTFSLNNDTTDMSALTRRLKCAILIL